MPDDSYSRKRDISRSAWDVWEHLCKCGDPQTGIVEARFVTNPRLVEGTRLRLGTVKNAMTELRKKGWIEERGARIHLLVGTFMKELRRLEREAKEEAKKPSPHNDAPSLVSDAPRRPSLRNDAPSPHNDAPSLVSDDHSNRGSRARSDQTFDQTEDQTHTHQTGAKRPVDKETRGSVCVCKVHHDSEFCDEMRLAYGRNTPSITNPPGYAQSKSVRGGRDDGLIRDWLGKVTNPASAPRARDTTKCPDCQGQGMFYPQGPGKGVKKCRHERLIDAGDTSPPESVRVAARSP